MNILGLIPARGGSKGIPHKNIVPLGGKPLLAYTCEAACRSTRLSRVVLSTDDPEIAEVGRSWGVDVPFMRPEELACDTTPSWPVAHHAVEWLSQNSQWEADILVLLQPTSPLRTTEHIDAALDIMLTYQADTVVSVVAVPHRFSPYNVMELNQGRLEHFWKESLPFDRFDRHAIPTFYARNGPAILAVRVPVLKQRQSFYGEHIQPYVMSEHDSLDIDTPFDLELVAWLMARN